MVKCPFCQFDNEDGTLYCEQCKSDLGTDATIREPPAALPVASLVDDIRPATRGSTPVTLNTSDATISEVTLRSKDRTFDFLAPTEIESTGAPSPGRCDPTMPVPPDPTDGMRDYGIANLDFKRVAGGLLVEDLDDLGLDRGQLQVVTRRRPTLEELTDLLFAWRAVRHVSSNAIVLARNASTVGIGAGQASRLVSVEIALRRAGDRAKTAVMASDAYFPFPDGIQLAAQAGVTAIIQPGGSLRDEMAIELADRHHLAMVFTGRRHFRH